MRTFVWVGILVVMASCVGADERPTTTATSTAADAEVQSPEETVRMLISAYLGKRLGEYYSLVASVDREVRSLESLQDEFAPNSSDLVTDYLFRYTKFRIDSSSVAGDSALVYVTSETPNVAAVVREAVVVERSLGGDSDLLTKMSLLNERLRMNGGGRVENPATYFLVREPKGWRAVVGWADRKAFEDQMRADSSQAGGT